MKIARPIAGLIPVLPWTSTRTHLFRTIGTVTALALFLCAGASSKLEGQQGLVPPIDICNGCGTVAAAAVGIVAGVAAVGIVIAVKHSHHVLKGCVYSAPNGLELQTSDKQTYLLEGNAADIKAGERVKLHGLRKKAKDHKNSFTVQKVSKDYGACNVNLALNATR